MKKHYVDFKRIGGMAVSALLAVCVIFSNVSFAMASQMNATTVAASAEADKYAAGRISSGVSGSEQQVALQIDTNTKAEVALAVGNTKVDYSAFESELKKALKDNHGISEDRVSFVEVDANATSSTNTFNWWKYDHVPANGTADISDSTHIYTEKNTSSSSEEVDLNWRNYGNLTTNHKYLYLANGKHIYAPSSNSMTFTGYNFSTYFKDFYYLPNTQSTKKTIEFTLKEDAYDALDGVGFFVNTSFTGNYQSGDQLINGYLVFFQYSGAYGMKIKLFRLENVNAKKLHHSNMYELRYLDSSSSTTYSGFGGTLSLIAVSDEYAFKDTSGQIQSNVYRKVKIEVMPTYLKMWQTASNTSSAFNVNLTDSNVVNWKTTAGSDVSYQENDGSYTYKTKCPLESKYDNVNGKEEFRGGFGPFASYASHSCTDVTSITLSNLKMDAEYVRSLTEVIRETNWDSEKQSFLVNLNEADIEDFSNQYTTGEIINRLNDNDISYIGWCGSQNVDDSKVFVDGVGNGSGLVNMNDSAYISGGNTYNSASRAKQVEAIATLIANKLATVNQGSEHKFLTTDNFVFTSTGATLNDGNWSVGYSKTSYADAKNNISTYQDLSTASFAMAGYYEVYYNGVTDTPKARIRIHEAPKAIFTASIKNDQIEIINKSYDPEFCTDTSNATGSKEDGIASNLIEYRNLSASNPEWTTTAPTSVGNDTWMVRLTVTDADGATASMVVQLKKSDSSITVAPYGTFDISSTQFIKGIDDDNTYVIITDKSYALDGTKDFKVYYTVTDPSDKNTSYSPSVGDEIKLNLSGLSEGTYKVSMYAQNGNTKSATVSKTFKVVQGYKVEYNANADDNTIKGIPSIQYKIKGQTLNLSNIAPTREGFTFNGWNTSAKGTGTSYKPLAAYNTNANLTLYAQWLENFVYSVNPAYSGDYDTNDHGIKVNVTNPESGYTVTYKVGDNGTEQNENVLKDAGTYKVHFTISKAGFQTVSSYRTVTINKIPLSAKLSDKTVSYDGTAKQVESTITGFAGNETVETSGINPVVKYYVDEACTTLTDSSYGADTVGGAPKEAGTYYAKLTIAESTNYKAAESNVAVLKVLKYNVTFDNKGYGNKPADQTGLVSGQTITEPERLTDNDYYFLGWYKEASCETPWDFANDTIEDKDVTLYAKWQLKSKFEAKWNDKDGNEHYGSFKDALDFAKKEHEKDPSSKTTIDIQNNVDVDEKTEIPEGVDINVKSPASFNIGENGSVKVPDGSSFNVSEGAAFGNAGQFDNAGKFSNEGTFDNNGKFNNAGTFDNGGTFNNNKESHNSGTFNNKTGSSMNNAGTFDNAKGGNYNNDGTVNNDKNGTIDNNGTFNNGQNADVNNNGNLHNNAGSTFDNNGTVDNKNHFNNEAGSTFNNNSEFKNENGADVSNTGDFNNNEGGHFDNSGTVGNTSHFNNEAGSEFDNNKGGQFGNTGDVNNAGTFNNNAESELDNKGNFNNGETGTVTNDGDFKNEEGSHVDNSGHFNNGETGTVSNNGDFKNEEGSHVDNSGHFNNGEAGTVTNDGDFKNEEGSHVDNSGHFNNGEAGTVTNDGDFKNEEGGTMSNNGDFNNNKDSHFDNDGKVDNSGNLNNNAGSKFDNNGNFKNEEKGTVSNNGDFNNNKDSYFDNDGKVDNAGNLNNNEGSKFDNNGDFRNEADGTVSNNGNFNNNNGSQFDNSGKFSNEAEGTVSNDGNFNNNEGAVLDNKGNISNNGEIKNNDGGKVNNDGVVSNNGNLINNGDVSNTGNISNSENASIIGAGNIANNGSITNEGNITVNGNVTGDGSISGTGSMQENVTTIVISKDNDTAIDGSVSADVGEGNVTIIIDSLDENNKTEGNIITGIKISSAYDFIKSAAGEDGITLIQNGTDMILRFSVIKKNNNATEEVKKVMENAVANASTKDKKLVIGEYLDITYEMKKNKESWVKLTNLDNEIEITIQIPEELRGKGVYYILRDHDGVCDMLMDLDDNPDTITFRTDRFSAYAIVYEEEPQTIESVNTGDNGITRAAVYILLAGLALASMGIVIRKKKYI